MVDNAATSRGHLLRYGVDAPYVPAGLLAGGIVCLGLWSIATGSGWLLIVGVILLIQAGIYLHATLRGKHRVWHKLLDQLQLTGDETTLDVGCGRGAVLLATARRLTTGRAHGVDLWRSVDQSGNAETVTVGNAAAEGVTDRVELHTGDMTNLPFPDATFDVVTSSLAIHNVPTAKGRAEALDEALRVLRPGGRLVIADIRNIRQYADHLRAAGATTVSARGAGPAVWFSGPWQATSIVTATKPPT